MFFFIFNIIKYNGDKMKNKNIELTLFISVLLISLFGVIMIYSSSNVWAEYKYNDPYKYLKNQGLFFIIGIIFMIIVCCPKIIIVFFI